MHINSSSLVLLAVTVLICLCWAFEQSELSLVVTIFGVALLLISEPKKMLMLLIPIVSLLLCLISSAIIENGAYIVEQFRYGYRSNATSLLSLYVVMLMAVLLITTNALFKGSERERCSFKIKSCIAAEIRLFSVFIFAIILIFFATMAVYGSAALQGENRFVYWGRLPPWLAETVKHLRALIGPVCCVYGYMFMRSSGRDRKKLSLLIFIMIVQLFLMGDKFSPFLNAVLFFVMGFSFYKIEVGEPVRLSRNAIPVIILTPILFIGIPMAGFVYQHGVALTDFFSAFSSRAALQGHVWFGIHELVSSSGAIIDFSDIIYPNSFETPTGLDKLSYFVSDYNFVSERISRGLTFTMGGPAAALAVGGQVGGALIYSSLGFVYALTIYYAFLKITRLQLIRGGAALLFLVSQHSVLLLGNWYSFYNSASALFLILLMVDLALNFKRVRIGGFKFQPPKRAL